MSKAVMISIKPKWVGLIASGQKTVEVRKTRPKIDTPFKCYIYQTKVHLPAYLSFDGKPDNPCGVVGEFICDKVFDICISVPNDLKPYEFPCTGLTDIEIMEYLGNGRTGYGWHISELKMYDKPKELSEFWQLCRRVDCRGCGKRTEKGACDRTLHRPFQSWGYVEEL